MILMNKQEHDVFFFFFFCVCVCVQVPEVLFLVPGETAQIHQQERLHHGECLLATAPMSLLSSGAGTSC